MYGTEICIPCKRNGITEDMNLGEQECALMGPTGKGESILMNHFIFREYKGTDEVRIKTKKSAR